jgi:allantoinase
MSKSLLIKDAKLILWGNEVVEGSILVEEGKIASILKDYKRIREVDEVIDGKGLLAVPGGIDLHAHIYDPDYLHHEDFRTGTIAAAFGGITTVYDMPLRLYVENEETFKIKHDNGLRNSLINFGILAGMMNEDNISNIARLRKLGVKGFKLFTCKPFRPEYERTLTEVIKTVDENDGVTIVHAEDDSIVDYLVNKFKNEGREDPLAHHESRPAEAEASAIAKIISIALYLDARVHIAHVSSALGADEVGKGKALGVKVSAETCPHYLYFTKDDVRGHGNYLKMTPSLKNKEDVEALWRALADGTIDAVASDHAPSPRDEKEVNVWDAWGGIPVIETMFPFVFTFGVKKLGIIDLERYVDITSRNPALIMDIYPRKGEIALGSDADIVLLDPELCMEVKPDKLHHKVDWTPFEGIELCGWPKHVILNGDVLIRDRELISESAKPNFL